MLVLAIETATSQVGVALGGPDGTIASFHLSRERRHAETLVPAIEFLCRHAQVDLEEVTLVAVDVGPGLFTGLRVGIATARAIAEARDVPLAGFSSLEVLAAAVPVRGRPIVATIDARRGEVYHATYEWVGEELRTLSEPRVGQPGAVAEAVAGLPGHPLVIGDGARRYAEVFEAAGELELAARSLPYPSADRLADLAVRRSLERPPAPGREVDVLYLREPDVS